MTTQQRPPYISSEDRDLAREAAKAQQFSRRVTLVPVLALLVSCLSVLAAVVTTINSNLAQRAELLRLLGVEMREALPGAWQAQMSRHEPTADPFIGIERRLQAPWSALRIWQTDIEEMRSEVAWRRFCERCVSSGSRPRLCGW